MHCAAFNTLTDFLSGNKSGGLQGKDWWTPAQTHASLSAPSQYPGEMRGDRWRQRR